MGAVNPLRGAILLPLELYKESQMVKTTKIIDIRGTHGSGKSTIPRQIISNYVSEPIIGLPLTYEAKKKSILGYLVPEFNLVILGRYETACGGCDGIKTQAEIKARIVHFEEKGYNILLEGILVSHTYGPWHEFATGRNWCFLFLDTPLEVCIDRVNSRRAAKGNAPLEDPVNIIKDHRRINSLHGKFCLNHNSKLIDYLDAYELVIEELTSED